ncbi:MAG: gene transfer agent family protein [Rhizobiaceae bacterium]|nr:gene transfer agent family protein [Rhizobiaceae bacterium]
MNPGHKVYPNRRRGEVLINIDNSPRIMCLTLGALAELEEAFNVDNLSELGTCFSNGKFGADDLVHIIGAGLRGGGNLYTDEDVRCLSIEGGALGLAQIAAELLKITFSCDREDDQVDKEQGKTAGKK